MNAATVPALTSVLATRLAKAAAPSLRWSTERAANGGRLVRVWDSPQELRDLNAARDLIREVGLTASVVALRSRSGRSQFRVLVTSEPEEAARLADSAVKRAAALEAARAEVAAADARRAVLADTADHYGSLALAARLASEAAWEEEAHAAGFASGAEYGEFLVAETVEVPDTDDAPEPARAETADELMARVLVEHPSVARRVARAEDRARNEVAATAREVARDRLSDGELRDLLGSVISPAPDREERIAAAVAARNANEPSVDGRVAVPYFPYAVPAEEVSGPLPSVASTDSHRSPAPATLPCYHVTTVRGEVYGVAATSVRDALQMTQDRLAGEGSDDLPKGARKVGRWAASYGTVLHY